MKIKRTKKENVRITLTPDEAFVAGVAFSRLSYPAINKALSDILLDKEIDILQCMLLKLEHSLDSFELYKKY